MHFLTLETTQPISEKEPRVLGYMMIRKIRFFPLHESIRRSLFILIHSNPHFGRILSVVSGGDSVVKYYYLCMLHEVLARCFDNAGVVLFFELES